MTYHYTPIGAVLVSFPHFAELMREAAFGYRDEEGVRRWYIEADKTQVPATKKRSTGRSYKDERDMRNSVNKHRKFCMILDALKHLCKRRAEFEDILTAAIGHSEQIKLSNGTTLDVGKRVASLRCMDWRACQNAVASMGVAGYEEVTEEDAFDL